jgi:hypothetical protein
MTRFGSLCAAMALTIGGAARVPAAPPLEYFSKDADVVVRLKAPQTTIAQVAALADAVQQGAGAMVRQNAAGLGQAIFVPGLAGVDQSRDWYVIFFARGRMRPNTVFAIPAANTEQLIAALPDRMTSATYRDWVLYTDSADGLPEAPEQGAGVSALLQEELAAVFNRGDVSLFINIDHLRDVYAEDIESGRQQFVETLEMLAQAGAQTEGVNVQAIIDMYRTMVDAGFQLLSDATACSVGVTAGAGGVSIEKYVAFADGSVTSQTIAANPTSRMELLAKLPADAVGYFGFSGDMQKLMEWSWSMSTSLLAGKPEQEQEFEDAMREWKEIDFGEMVGSFSVGTAADGLMRYTAIAQATPIAKVRETWHKIVQIMGTIEAYGLKQEMTIQPEAETIEDHKLDLLTVKQEYDSERDPTGMQQKIMEFMVGKNGMESRIAYLDDAYVMATGGGRDAMQTLLKSYDAAANDEVARHRKGLMDKANLLVLIDLPTLAANVLTEASKVPELPFPIDAEGLSQLPIETSYLGLSLAGEAHALRVKTVIPVEQLRGVMSLVGFFQK